MYHKKIYLSLFQKEEGNDDENIFKKVKFVFMCYIQSQRLFMRVAF